ncbi:integrase core domain-containing protein [Flavihumibacter fluminis]|uniref:integrase core domain-containing protein n=1 Tax=Flavihumibacter fluminis TaxID=2909236 RepID=UPI00336A550C
MDFKYIQPGKQSHNAYVERFNRSYRGHVLDAHSFDNLNQVRELSETWVADYKNHRPHD